jgi:PAS domain-containing protein
MSAVAENTPTRVLRRGWGKLPLSPIRSSVRSTPVSRLSKVPPASVAQSVPTNPAVIATDAQGVITAFNPIAENLFGYHALDLIGQATPEIFHDPEEISNRTAQYSTELREPQGNGYEVLIARARHDQPYDEEWDFLCQDGSRVRVLLSITRLRDTYSETLGYVITAIPLP